MNGNNYFTTCETKNPLILEHIKNMDNPEIKTYGRMETI